MKTNKPLRYVTVAIKQDTDSGNPRDEFDHLSIFYGERNNRYITGGKNDHQYSCRETLDSAIREFKREGAIIESFRSNAGECFAVIERDAIIEEYGNDSRSSLYHARQVAKGEIEEYLNWANGEVYGYIITDNETGETLDSCWGFYGRQCCEEEAQRQAEYFDKELSDKARQISARLETVSA